MSRRPEELAAIRAILLEAAKNGELWGTAVSINNIPPGLDQGSDQHLAYLTLVYAISGGRAPGQLWQAAQALVQEAPNLFDPNYLAYEKPKTIEPLLKQAAVIRKKSEATVWQRIGQALVMRAQGSVQKLLADHDNEAEKLMAMLAANKTTFPVLSGEQTAPRWLWGLANEGGQSIEGAAQLPVSVSPAAARALASLEIEAERVSAEIFAALDALGRHGCRQRPDEKLRCPVAAECPVSSYCQFGS